MSKNVGWIIAVVGIIVLLLAIFAAPLGLGGSTWGLKHIIALVVGIVLIVAGAYTALRPSRARA